MLQITNYIGLKIMFEFLSLFFLLLFEQTNQKINNIIHIML